MRVEGCRYTAHKRVFQMHPFKLLHLFTSGAEFNLLPIKFYFCKDDNTDDNTLKKTGMKYLFL